MYQNESVKEAYNLYSIFVFLVPPKVSITPQQVSVNLGESIRLFCVSSPPFPLTWTKLKGTISNSAVIDGGVMIIEETTVQDSGKYRCQATNDAGSTDSVAMVTVFGTFRAVKLF